MTPEPMATPVYDLEILLAGMTDENLHKGMDFGEPQGREASSVRATVAVRHAH
jgi:hypothetical protein